MPSNICFLLPNPYFYLLSSSSVSFLFGTHGFLLGCTHLLRRNCSSLLRLTHLHHRGSVEVLTSSLPHCCVGLASRPFCETGTVFPVTVQSPLLLCARRCRPRYVQSRSCLVLPRTSVNRSSRPCRFDAVLGCGRKALPIHSVSDLKCCRSSANASVAHLLLREGFSSYIQLSMLPGERSANLQDCFAKKRS